MDDTPDTARGAGAEPMGVQRVVSRLGPAAVLGAMAAVLPAIGGFVLLTRIDAVGSWLRSHGDIGPVVYAAGFAVLAGFALLPTYASAILGGWAFGVAVGLPAALCGFLGGSLIGYAVARPTAASRVEGLLAEKPKWRTVRDALVGSGWWRTLAMVTLLRLPPNSPFAVTNLVLASVRVPVLAYSVGTLIGMTPRTAVVLVLASQLQSKMASEAAKADKPWWLLAVGVALSVVVLGVIGIIANKALAKFTNGPGSGAPAS